MRVQKADYQARAGAAGQEAEKRMDQDGKAEVEGEGKKEA